MHGLFHVTLFSTYLLNTKNYNNVSIPSVSTDYERNNNKITLVNIKFNLSACKNLSKNELDNLSDTAREIFILFYNLEITSSFVIL